MATVTGGPVTPAARVVARCAANDTRFPIARGTPLVPSVRRLLTRLTLAGLASLALRTAATAAGEPIVVVYPLTTTGGTDTREVGASIATALSQRLAQLGGLDIKPAPPGTARTDFLTAAVAESADYYVTGYATPLGNDISLVEQVVSTHSGSVVFSQTALAKNYDEAVGPAANLRSAILSHAGRGFAALSAPPPPSATPEPAPSNGGAFDIGKMLHRRPRAAGTPKPATVALAPATPAPDALALATDGDANPTERAYASATLLADLKASGRSTVPVAFGAGELVANVGSICRSTAQASRFYASSLSISRGAIPHVRYDLSIYDCAKAQLKTIRTDVPSPENQPLDEAIRAAVGKAIAEIPK